MIRRAIQSCAWDARVALQATKTKVTAEMEALVFHGQEVVRCESGLDDPQIWDEGDVIVRVLRAGICGSDLHQFHGREPVADGTIPGHEFVGEIVEVGSAVRSFSIGQRVFSPFTTCCGKCFFCQNGLSARCNHHYCFGYRPPVGVEDGGKGIQGAQAELLRVPQAETTLVSLPSELSIETALLLGDNFTTGFFCADSAEIRREGITVVIGCGAVGLSAICAAKYLGAEQVIAVDRVDSRRQRAASLGAKSVSPEEALECVQKFAARTGQNGADSVLEAVGHPLAQRLAFELVRPGGVISAVGMHTSEHFSFSPLEAYDNNVQYKAGRCPVRSYLDRLVPEVLEGRLHVPVEKIVTHNGVALKDGPQAYEQFSQRVDDCVKVLLDPTLGSSTLK